MKPIVELEQRVVGTEEEVRNTLKGLQSMGIMHGHTPGADKTLARIVLVVEIKGAEPPPEKKRRGPFEVSWNPFG
jgi:hypothetical protein